MLCGTTTTKPPLNWPTKCSNKRVAEFIGKPKKGEKTKTFVYRIHDEPNQEKLLSLSNFVKKFGYDLKTEEKEVAHSINDLLKKVQGSNEEDMIEQLTIRTMAKAVYSSNNIGHYGLGFNHYSHFTSPIRRYPDVMVHRLLLHYLNNGSSPPTELYEDKSKHCSNMEYLATKAERDSIKYMQIRFMQDHKDDEFKGVISGVTDWGIYVEIIENKTEFFLFGFGAVIL